MGSRQQKQQVLGFGWIPYLSGEIILQNVRNYIDGMDVDDVVHVKAHPYSNKSHRREELILHSAVVDLRDEQDGKDVGYYRSLVVATKGFNADSSDNNNVINEIVRKYFPDHHGRLIYGTILFVNVSPAPVNHQSKNDHDKDDIHYIIEGKDPLRVVVSEIFDDIKSRCKERKEDCFFGELIDKLKSRFENEGNGSKGSRSGENYYLGAQADFVITPWSFIIISEPIIFKCWSEKNNQENQGSQGSQGDRINIVVRFLDKEKGKEKDKEKDVVKEVDLSHILDMFYIYLKHLFHYHQHHDTDHDALLSLTKFKTNETNLDIDWFGLVRRLTRNLKRSIDLARARGIGRDVLFDEKVTEIIQGMCIYAKSLVSCAKLQFGEVGSGENANEKKLPSCRMALYCGRTAHNHRMACSRLCEANNGSNGARRGIDSNIEKWADEQHRLFDNILSSINLRKESENYIGRLLYNMVYVRTDLLRGIIRALLLLIPVAALASFLDSIGLLSPRLFESSIIYAGQVIEHIEFIKYILWYGELFVKLFVIFMLFVLLVVFFLSFLSPRFSFVSQDGSMIKLVRNKAAELRYGLEKHIKKYLGKVVVKESSCGDKKGCFTVDCLVIRKSANENKKNCCDYNSYTANPELASNKILKLIMPLYLKLARTKEAKIVTALKKGIQ